MKFAELRSIGHNAADSLGSGVGFLIGLYGTDIFEEARRSPERCIGVDFLSGKVISGNASPSLSRAIALYKAGFANLCKKHRASPTMFRELTVLYSVGSFNDRRAVVNDRRLVVTVEDHQGRRAVDEYVGIAARRIRILDHLGRVRRKRDRAPMRSGR